MIIIDLINNKNQLNIGIEVIRRKLEIKTEKQTSYSSIPGGMLFTQNSSRATNVVCTTSLFFESTLSEQTENKLKEVCLKSPNSELFIIRNDSVNAMQFNFRTELPVSHDDAKFRFQFSKMSVSAWQSLKPDSAYWVVVVCWLVAVQIL